jgi:hypothetical protein
MVGREAQLETRGLPPTSYGGSSAVVLIVDHVICLFPMSGRSRAANSTIIRGQPCSKREPSSLNPIPGTGTVRIFGWTR